MTAGKTSNGYVALRVRSRGALTGIFALDDGIDLITGLLCDISGSIKSGQRPEWAG